MNDHEVIIDVSGLLKRRNMLAAVGVLLGELADEIERSRTRGEAVRRLRDAAWQIGEVAEGKDDQYHS